MRKAFITGITGQDGSYLAELLLNKGYEVHAMQRRSSVENLNRVKHLPIKLHYGDLTDSGSILTLLDSVVPDEIYNLGAQSHVKISFDIPEYTADVDALGTLRLLEAMRVLKLKSRFYQAGTSELFGKVQETPQTETTPFYPRSPYGVAKLFSYWIVVNYREAYDFHASNGILFNHESPRRGDDFVTQKVIKQAIEVINGERGLLLVGNLEAKRDWGHAKDYVEGMWRIVQKETSGDYILATGRTNSVRDLVEYTFRALKNPITWEGEGLNEVGILENKKVAVRISKEYYRPTEVDLLMGDASKAHKELGWTPVYSFEGLLDDMIKEALNERA